MSATVVPFTPVRQPLTVHAAIKCIDCPWSAVHTGDNAIEVSAFLRDLYRRHLTERHPDLQFEEPPS